MMHKHFFSFCVLALLTAGGAPALAQPARPGGEEQLSTPARPFSDVPGGGAREEWSPGFHHGPGRGRGLEFREEQRRLLERARDMAQRVLDDPSAPDEVKAKARRLTELLDKRESLVRDLGGKRQSFLQEHAQDIAQLRQLREQGEVIHQRLRAAREQMVAENLPVIQEMRRTTQDARKVAVELRGYYHQRRHDPERPAPPDEE
ncbi:MAG TPA: hypothetical protein VKJ47_15940 [Candidatus Binatia bacterium]|nr:hypothetical protein [Candidatus Binatia bacterium]